MLRFGRSRGVTPARTSASAVPGAPTQNQSARRSLIEGLHHQGGLILPTGDRYITPSLTEEQEHIAEFWADETELTAPEEEHIIESIIKLEIASGRKEGSMEEKLRDVGGKVRHENRVYDAMDHETARWLDTSSGADFQDLAAWEQEEAEEDENTSRAKALGRIYQVFTHQFADLRAKSYLILRNRLPPVDCMTKSWYETVLPGLYAAGMTRSPHLQPNNQVDTLVVGVTGDIDGSNMFKIIKKCYYMTL